MFSTFKKRLDRWAIHAACSTVTYRGVLNDGPRLAKLFRSPDLTPRITGVGELLSFSTNHHFSFPSPLSSRWPENNRAHGKIWTAGHHWRERPMVFLIHGWNGEGCYHYLFPRLARELVRIGINAVALELPYHGERKPRSPGAITNFISDDLGELLHATQQALSDFAYLENWARHQGCQKIGLWGFSLGGWLAGLLSSIMPGFDFSVLANPICRLDRVVEELAFCEPIRRARQITPLLLEAFNLKSYCPQTAKERLLLIKSEYDLFVPPETVEELWKAWNYPEIWRLPESHLSVLFSRSAMKKIIRWIEQITGRSEAKPGRDA